MNRVELMAVPQTKPLTIIFCLPGRSFSGNFLRCWSTTLYQCIKSGIRPLLIQEYDPVVYYARNKCLGGNVLLGKYQKPYNGEIDYDYIMWIDSDIIFNFEQIEKLISRNVHIVSGIYMMADNKHFASVLNWDIEFFEKNGFFKFMTPDDIKGKSELMEVVYSGFGFMLIKKGVFESIEYPWFRPVMHTFSTSRDIVDFSSEDCSMCLIFREKGYKIFIDPTVRVGHEKSIVL